MKKYNFLIGAFFFLLFNFAETQLPAQSTGNLIEVSAKAVRIEVTVSDVDVIVAPFDGAVISYKIALTEKSKLSVVNRGKDVRFSVFKPAKGTLFIYIPKDVLLESLRIQSSNSNIHIKGIKAIYFVASGTGSNMYASESLFKNVLIAAATGRIEFNSRIIAVADFCISSAEGIISIPESEEDCNILMTQSKNEYFTFKGDVYTKNNLAVTPIKPKKFITIASSFSKVAVDFIPIPAEPEEKFDTYGISEFGPKPPPRLVNELSNFLPNR